MLSAMLNPLSIAFDADSANVAWLVSSYAFAYAIAAPFLGFLWDRIDQCRLLLIALLSFAIDGIGIAFSPTLGIAIALRIFGGLASAVIIPATFAPIERPHAHEGERQELAALRPCRFHSPAALVRRRSFQGVAGDEPISHGANHTAAL